METKSGTTSKFNGFIFSSTIIAYGCHVCYYMYIAIFNRGPSIDASYQVSVYLAKWFQRRRLKCEKLTDDRHQVKAVFSK
jgi:L-amino acid N-acyltransferase YncA